MKLYVNFINGCSYEVGRFNSISFEDGCLTTWIHDAAMGSHDMAVSTEFIQSITAEPEYTCYVFERLAAAFEYAVHPEDIVWRDGGWVRKSY